MLSLMCKLRPRPTIAALTNANNALPVDAGAQKLWVSLSHSHKRTLAFVGHGHRASCREQAVDRSGFKYVNGFVGGQRLLKSETMRSLSTLERKEAVTRSSLTISKDESGEFMSVFPELTHDLIEVANKYKCNDAANWFKKALEYNVPRGKKNRGILTVLAYKNLVKHEQLTPANVRLAQYLGWCVEMLQCFLIMADDIMDNSSTRRGQPCWHTVQNVGLIAINDSVMIENAIYAVLKKHFSQLQCYVSLMELFHEITFITTCGQSLDLLNSNKNVTAFTMDNYRSTVANKTAYYTFYLPFAVAMHFAGIEDAEAFRQSKSILLDMGHFFQVQDDFLDCFGDPSVTGKIGTDIQDNKCSWLAVLCMELGNDEQRAIMAECYGHQDAEKVKRVKELYKTLDIPGVYARYEEESYGALKTSIGKLSGVVPHEIFLQILNKIYQRDS